MKTIYMWDILKDLWKRKVFVVVCLLICTGLGTITGYKKSNFYDRISAKEKVKVEDYFEKTGKYEQNIKDTEEGIRLFDDKIKELQEYIDNSIFMHLNPDKIYVADIKYSSESLINEADFLKDKYWSEVLDISKKDSYYNISMMHSSEEQLLESVNKIAEIIKNNYKISKPIINCYIKADINIANKQKEVLNGLSEYIKKRAELENSLKEQKTFLAKFKLEEKPQVLFTKELRPISIIFRYALFGFVASAIVLISIFTIRRIL